VEQESGLMKPGQKSLLYCLDKCSSVTSIIHCSSVGIAVRFLAEARDFSLHHNVQTASYSMSLGAVSPVAERLGCKADHSSPYLYSPIRLLGAVLN
jgi:hypothetical protein